MKPILIIVLLVLSLQLIAQDNCECVLCRVSCSSPASAHTNPACPVYKNYHSASATSHGANIEQVVMQSIFTNMFNNFLNSGNNSKRSEADKIRQQQEEQIKQQRLAAMQVLQKKYNDSVAQARHDIMMKEYKLLDAGTKDLKYKGLTDGNYGDPSVVILNEQNYLDRNTQSWVEYQKEQFRIRTEQPNYWCEKYFEDLKKQDSAAKAQMAEYKDFVLPKRINEIQAGDVILVGNGNPVQIYLDNKINNDSQENCAHTLTCVKVFDGHRFYLDNQLGEGPRIITEEQMINRYGKRDLNVAELRGKGNDWKVAQPLSKMEGDRLWNKALELHNKNRDKTDPGYESKDNSEVNRTLKNMVYSNYGLFRDDNLVCSEASWILINSTGRYQIPEFKNEILSKTGIKFTPTSFYNTQQYFIITPLGTDK